MCCSGGQSFGSIRSCGHGLAGDDFVKLGVGPMKHGLKGLLIFLFLGLSLGLEACGDAGSREVAAAQPAPEAPAKSAAAAADDSFVASGPLIVEHQVDVAAQ